MFHGIQVQLKYEANIMVFFQADAVNLSVEELAMIGAALPVIERFSAIASTGEEEESKAPGHNSYTVGDKVVALSIVNILSFEHV